MRDAVCADGASGPLCFGAHHLHLGPIEADGHRLATLQPRAGAHSVPAETLAELHALTGDPRQSLDQSLPPLLEALAGWMGMTAAAVGEHQPCGVRVRARWGGSGPRARALLDHLMSGAPLIDCSVAKGGWSATELPGVDSPSGVLVVFNQTCSPPTPGQLALLHLVGAWLGRSLSREAATRRAAELEENLRRQRRLDSIGLLAGGVAHDLNNMLTGVITNTVLVRESTGDCPFVQECLDDIESSARSAAQLTNNLLTWAGRRTLELGEVSLNSAVSQARRALATQERATKRVRLRLHPDAPVVLGDRSQVQQVVLNLIQNALDAIGSGEGAVEVRTRPLEAGGVSLEVEDNGPGMSEATLQRIFEPYFTTRPNGRGIGLASVMGIVRNHGGAVQVHSTLGEGTRFAVTLPASPTRSAVGPTVTERAPAAVDNRAVILVVDDDQAVLRTTSRVLQNAGYITITAECGRQAIQRFAANQDRVSAVLLDLTMNDMDGDEVLRRIRKIDSGVPVVVFSAWASDEVYRRMDRTDIAGFVHKPYARPVLLRTIHGAIATRPRVALTDDQRPATSPISTQSPS